MRTVHVVVPDGIDDHARPSGGNVYDRRICQGLPDVGWTVREHQVPGSWPTPDRAAELFLRALVASFPDTAVVLVDGLIASAVPSVLVPEAQRLRLLVLVHLPLGDAPAGQAVSEAQRREGEVLSAARGIITTSGWTRRQLLHLYGLSPDRVVVAEPGVDAAGVAPGTAAGQLLLCVAAVSEHKGHDQLLGALATIRDLPWQCLLVGSLDRNPTFVTRLHHQVTADRVDDRVRFRGPLTGAELAGAYASADVLVLASRAETYGMVVTEALACGLPVIATAVGGVPEALGRTSDGSRPGLLVPAGHRVALASALRSWLEDADLRDRLRRSARQRRRLLSDWSVTCRRIGHLLAEQAQDAGTSGRLRTSE